MEETLSNNNEQKKSIFSKINGVVALIMAIASVILGYFWYLAIPLGVIALIASMKKIKETGKTLPKAAMIISVIGIVHCVMVYVSVFFMIYSSMGI
jgi:hypothetical protein